MIAFEGQPLEITQLGQLGGQCPFETVGTQVKRRHASFLVGVHAMPFVNMPLGQPVRVDGPIRPVHGVVQCYQHLPVRTGFW